MYGSKHIDSDDEEGQLAAWEEEQRRLLESKVEELQNENEYLLVEVDFLKDKLKNRKQKKRDLRE